MPHLLDPIQIGDLHLPNRVIMAPLTRLRGTPDHLPTPLMTEYYRQRASAGMIITEGTPISPMGVGYAQVPGIWSAAQAELWKPVTAAVHEAGGRILAQIWHVGRVSDPSFLDGKQPVAPSAIAPPGTVTLIRPKKDFETPRALSVEEIHGVVEDFRLGAQNAKDAGFDGVEIHGANGYLLDQFLHDRQQHARRRVWRLGAEPRQAAPGGGRRRDCSVGPRPRRHAPGTARRRDGNGRREPAGDLYLPCCRTRQTQAGVPDGARVFRRRSPGARAQEGVWRGLYRQ